MAAYVIFDVHSVTDKEKMDRYRREVKATVNKYGGRYVVVGGERIVLEGSWRPTTVVLIEFPDLERARQWFDSPEYRPLKELRLAASECDVVIVSGLPPEYR